MATSDITYNSTFADLTRQVSGRIEITNSPTAQDLKTVAEGGTITGLQYLDKLFVIEKDIHLMTNASFENIRNVDILMRGGARFTNATNSPSADNPLTDGQIKLNNIRLLWQRHDTDNNIWYKWPFRSYSTQSYSNWAKISGGSFTSINDNAAANGIRLGFSAISNYRISSNSFSPNIDQVIFRNTQTATNLELSKVNRIVVENSANCFLENITHDSPDAKSVLVTRYASLILNGWNTNDTNTEIRQYTHQTGDTARDHYIYFLGTASSHFPSQHSDIIITQGTDAQRQRAHWKSGGLRYYQIYKDGEIHTAFRTGIFRGTAEQKSKPNTTSAEMLETQSSDYNHADGKIKLVAISNSITHNGTSWETETITDNVLKIRSPDIIFQSIPLNQIQAQESIGSDTSFVPFAVSTDTNYTTDTGNVLLAITSVLGIIGNGTLQNLYNKLKHDFTNEIQQDIQIGRNGTWLTVDKHVDLSQVTTLTPDSRFKGIWVTDGGFNQLNQTKQKALENGIALRSSEDGIGLVITSNVENTKIAISKSSEKTTPTYHTLPQLIFLEENTEYTITAKAKNYQYQQHVVNSSNTTGTLNLTLRQDTNIESIITVPDSTQDKFELTNPLGSNLTIDITGEIDLTAERDLSKKIFDNILQEDEGLLYLHDHEFPAVRFEFDRIMVYTTNIRWEKSTTPDVYARFGVPFYDLDTETRYYAERSPTYGIVQFDSLQLIGLVQEERVKQLEEKFETVVKDAHEITNEKLDDLAIDSLGYIELSAGDGLLDYSGGFIDSTFLNFVKKIPDSNQAQALKFNSLDGKFYGDRSFAFSTENIRAVKKIGNHYYILSENNKLIKQGLTSATHQTFSNYDFKSFAHVQGHFIFVGRNSSNQITISQRQNAEFENYNTADFTSITDTLAFANAVDTVDCEELDGELFVIKNGMILYRYKLEFTDNELVNLEKTGEISLTHGKSNSPLIRFKNYLWYQQHVDLGTEVKNRYVPITPDTLQIIDDVQYHKSAEFQLLEKIDDIDGIVETNLDAMVSTRLPTADYSPTVNVDLTPITADLTAVKSKTDLLNFANVAIAGEDPDWRLKVETWYETIAGTTMTAGGFLSEFHADINTALTNLGTANTNIDSAITKLTTAQNSLNDIDGIVILLRSRLNASRSTYLDNLQYLTQSRMTHLDGLSNPDISTLATQANLTTKATEIITEINANETKINAIKNKTDRMTFVMGAHIQSSIQDVKGTDVTNINDFKANVNDLASIKSQTDKMRFTGEADENGKQKIDASATVVGNVESSGLTEEQNNQLDHIYNQTLVDPDDSTVSLREQVNAVKTRVDQIPISQVDISELATTSQLNTAKTEINTNIDSNETKIDAIKTVVDTLPTSTADLTGIARSSEITAAKTAIQTDLQTNEDKIDGVKTAVDNIDLTDIATTQNITDAQDSINENINDNETKIDNIKTVVDNLPTTVTPVTDLTDVNTKLDNIKTNTDKMQFTDNNDIKSTLDGETVTTDAASREASKATIPTADISAIKTETDKIPSIKTVIDRNLNAQISSRATPSNITTAVNTINTNIDANETKIDNIKTKTDKLTFNNSNDIIASLDGETVTTGDISESALNAIRTEIEDEDNKVHDIQGKVTAIKERTDKLAYQGEPLEDPKAKLHTYTDVQVDADNITINLETVESGIEEILTQLTDDSDEDLEPTALKKLKEIGIDTALLRKIQIADIETSKLEDGSIETRFIDSESGEILLRTKPRPILKGVDYSGGREVI